MSVLFHKLTLQIETKQIFQKLWSKFHNLICQAGGNGLCV